MALNLRSTVAALAVVLAAFAFTSTSAQQQGAAGRGMMAGQQKMMAGQQKMMAQMEASQKKLDEMVARMNAATGDDKVAQLAAIVTELVASHRQMHAHMMQMMSQQADAPAAGAGTTPPAAGQQHVHE